MKKINLTDKTAICIVVLNLLSILMWQIFYDKPYDYGLFREFMAINYLYIVLGIPLSVFLGVMMNVSSLVVKVKTKISFKINIWLFFILLLYLPVWQHFIWQLLLS